MEKYLLIDGYGHSPFGFYVGYWSDDLEHKIMNEYSLYAVPILHKMEILEADMPELAEKINLLTKDFSIKEGCFFFEEIPDELWNKDLYKDILIEFYELYAGY